MCISLISIQALIYRGDAWMCEKSVETCLKKKHFRTFYISTTGKILLGKRTTLQPFGGNLTYDILVHIKVFISWVSELCCQHFLALTVITFAVQESEDRNTTILLPSQFDFQCIMVFNL
jgi:hypothetical protein